MAIYHCSLKVFSRSKGQSAVAAAAYRSGTTLVDARYQKTHRYENRGGIAETFIVLPENTSHLFVSDTHRVVSDAKTQKECLSGHPDRAALWNAVEASERRKNSCVARELVLALPHELSEAARSELTRDMASWLMERYRVAVDTAIHKPAQGDGHDRRNHHAHLLFSTREITEDGFGKKTRILDDKTSGKIETEVIREVWETLANDALKRAGFSDIQIDRRSLEEQGIDRIPQTHVGPASTHAENQPSSHEEEEGKDDEEEDGDKSSSSGSAGGAGGAVTPSLDLELAELKETAAKEETRFKHDRGSRADFVEEIKALNAERAAFSANPLKDQISHIDKLMAKLDTKVSRLERLKERTSLSNRLKRSLEKLMEISAAAVLNRKESSAAFKLSEGEKQARAERQTKHYGRTYRAGLHEQIKEMKHNIETLKTKQQEYTRYKGFVEQIEKQLDQHSPSERISLKTPSVKSISNEESSLKLALKANIAREQIPTEYKAKAGDKLTSLKVNPKETQPNIRNEQSKTKNNTKSIEIKPPIENNNLDRIPKLKLSIKDGSEAKAASTKARAVFNFNAELDPKIKNDPNPPYKQKIKNFDPIKTHAAKQEKSTQFQDKSERKNWHIPASEKTKPMMESINKKIAEMKREQPQREKPQHDLNRMKGQFNATAENIKRTTNEAHRAKTRAEAEVKRAGVPPEYRAKSYEVKRAAKPQEQDLKGRAQSTFKDAQDALKSKWENFRAGEKKVPESEPESEKPRVKMASGFNQASFEGVEGAEQGQDHSMDDEPETIFPN